MPVCSRSRGISSKPLGSFQCQVQIQKLSLVSHSRSVKVLEICSTAPTAIVVPSFTRDVLLPKLKKTFSTRSIYPTWTSLTSNFTMISELNLDAFGSFNSWPLLPLAPQIVPCMLCYLSLKKNETFFEENEYLFDVNVIIMWTNT